MNSASPSPPGGTLAAALVEVAALLEKRPAAADARAREILKSLPGQQQALMLLVGARRAAGDIDGARQILETAAATNPKLAAVQYELGLLLASLEEPSAAIAALSRVVELEPHHPSAWRALGHQLARAGKPAAAAEAYARHFGTCVAELQMLESATAAADDQLAPAEAMLKELIKIHPTDVTLLNMLASVGMRLKRHADAEKLLARALELAPDFSLARYTLASALFHQTREDEAIAQLDPLLEKEPDQLGYLNLKAMALLMVGEYDQAIACYETMLEKHPKFSSGWVSYSHALKTVGRQKEAIAANRKAIALAPGHGDAYWSLANLKTFRFAPEDLKSMRAELLRGSLSHGGRTQMHFALGKALEDAKDYAASFEQYAKANALRRQEVPYVADETTDFVKRSKALYTPAYFGSRAGVGCDSADPIFIVGLTRSGSTLIEQILASHSAVEGTKELPTLNFLAIRLGPRCPDPELPYPEIVGSLPAKEFKALGEEFIARTRIHRKLGRVHFIDKTPSNFQHLGFLHSILPNARIIDARRHPLSCGFANFKQFFAAGQPYSYDLADIGRYYRDYVELMAHFDAVLPGRVHRVFYEHLVEDPEREVRRLLAHCGLPYEESCLHFYESDRPVLTASSEQVRQPIFKDAVDLWRHYEPWLDPMKMALGNVLDAYPGVPAF